MIFSEAVTAGLQGGYQSSDKIPKWPLNGGVPCHTTHPGERNIERLYVAGYQDGTIRIWDVTYPLLSPLLTIDLEVRHVTVAGVSAPVSALDFSSEAQFLAVGSDSGLVRLYNLSGSCNENVLHVVTEAKSEVKGGAFYVDNTIPKDDRTPIVILVPGLTSYFNSPISCLPSFLPFLMKIQDILIHLVGY